MIVYSCKQGTPEWHQARAGVITASMFSEVRKVVGGLTEQQAVYVNAIRGGSDEAAAKEAAGYKAKPTSSTIAKALAGEKVGDFSDAAKDYAFRVAVERISGESLDEGGFDTFAMRRGRELEPEARAAHSFEKGVAVNEIGFVCTDDSKFGASADGLIGEDGGAEYKCFIDPAKLRDIILGGDLSDVMDQVQGCMWLTGRKWWHFCLYCPALAKAGREITIFEVERDDDYIEKMEADLVAFDRLVVHYEAQLRGENQS